LGNWVRSLLSRPLPPPQAAEREVEVEAEEEGRDAGNREEVEVGGEEADHLVIMVNGLSGRCVGGIPSLLFLFMMISSLV
jgi:hypothetical protein